MKRFLAIFLLCALLMTTLSSCDLIDKIKDLLGMEPPACEEHKDTDGDYLCDNCGEELPHINPHEHEDADSDQLCDICGVAVEIKPPHEHSDLDEDYICDECGAELERPVCEHTDADGDSKCDSCGEELQVPPSPPPACEEHTDADFDFLCDVCGAELERYEDVRYYLNISDLEAGVRDGDDIQNVFTIVSGTEVRNRTRTFDGVEYTKSVKIGGSANAIKINVLGSGKLSFLIQNGSNGAQTQKVKIIAPDGTAQEIEFAGQSESSPVVKIELDVTEGVWTIARVSGTIDIYELTLECKVEKSPENGFKIAASGNVDFVVGQTFDFSGLVLQRTFANGKTEHLPLNSEDVTVDTSAVNMLEGGIYEVKISYKDYDPITYKVNVYAVEYLSYGTDAVEKLSENTSAGNGIYYNHSFKEVYKVGEAYDARGLSVYVEGSLNNYRKQFIIEDYTISELDTSTSGVKTLVMTYTYGENTVIASRDVYVVDAAPSIVDGVYQVKVDRAFEGIVGSVVDGYNMFLTVQQALDFLSDADANAKKVIELTNGIYQEKIEITIPNLTIRGNGSIISWNSLYGQTDDSGFVHTTDSTQTVAVREEAYNCRFEDLNIYNEWRSKEYFEIFFGSNHSEHRALALLVQADRFVMKGGALKGYQDTVEFFTGRQLLDGVYISGTTDFIFGTNNTTFFKNCTIHSISSGKTDGGYITAFKGSNKGEQDAVEYGAVFYQCKFTADDDVVANGNTAIGRPWGAYAAVATIECEMAGHISKKGFSGSSKNERYVSMNAKPTDSGVKFVEYGNTGAGALAEAVAGMRMLTAEEAAKYYDYSVIFGTTNGGVTYLDAWDPTSSEVAVDDRIYYHFDGKSTDTGTSYTYDQNLQGTIDTFGVILIDATEGKVTARESDTQINSGAFLAFDVDAGTLVTLVAYSAAYNNFLMNGVGSTTDRIVQYYAEDTTVVVTTSGTSYLFQIIIDPNSEAPESAELLDLDILGLPTTYKVGEGLNWEAVKVNAHYSDGTYITVSEYTVDASAVNTAQAGTYPVVITYGGKSVTLDLTFEAPDADPAITESTKLDFSTTAGLEAVQSNPRVTIDGSVRHNGGEIQISGTISFMVKAGTVITVNPYANTQYASFTIGMEGEEGLNILNSTYTYTADEDCTIVYTGLTNNYLISIDIFVPAVISESTSITFGSEGNYKDVKGLDISGANIRDNGGNNSQISSGTIVFKVKAGATVVINSYSGYTSYTFSDGTMTTAEINGTMYVYGAESDVEITLTTVNGNNYLYGIDITY